MEEKELNPSSDGEIPEERVVSGSIQFRIREPVDQRGELTPKRPNPSQEIVYRQCDPSRPFTIIFRAVPSQRRMILRENAANPFEKHLMVPTQMREILTH